MVSLAGASAPLIFGISTVGMVATASSLAQFAGSSAGVIVNKFLCLAQNSSVPRASVVDLPIRNHIPYLGWSGGIWMTGIP